jgi:S1-C subfamily serine protease
MMQVETPSGLVATTSLDRFVPWFDGNPQESDRWVHGIQPAWSLDILWVPCREIACRRLFGAHQVALSRVPPRSVVSLSPLAGTGRPPQLNRSVLGGVLQNNAADFGWGIGVQGQSELTFELPASARQFRAGVTLDRASGKGGCIRARVLLETQSRTPLWESPFLVGADAAAEVAVAIAPPQGGQARLVLQIDAAHEGRPAGADPFDIRDLANWCDPLLELDPALVQSELDARLPKRFLAWKDAAVRLDPPAGPPPTVTYTRNEQLPTPGSFETALAAPGRTIIVTRELTLHERDQWLVISAVRPPNQPKAPKLHVRIAGEPVGEQEVPQAQGDPTEVRPLGLPLEPYQRAGGGTMRVEIRQLPQEPPALVQWRLLSAAAQLPTLYCMFEEDAPAEAAQCLSEEDRHHGLRSLRVAPGSRVTIRLAAPVSIRERPRWGEYRFLRFAVRKKGKGRAALELATAQPRQEPARYDAGKGEPAFGAATRVWTDELPDQWIVVTRDLFADFGSIDLASVTLACPDGEAAWFDHLYLGRSGDDFQLIPAAPSADKTNEQARQELARQIVERVGPAVVTLQLPDGRIGGGWLFRPHGEILAAGHFLRTPNLDVTVRMADGKTAKAKSLGISRELDLGLVKIVDQGTWPAIPLDDHPQIDPSQVFVALVFPPAATADARPEVRPCILRRFFRTTLWTDADADGFTVGGLLADAQGKAIGLHTRRSQFGGFLFSRLSAQELPSHLERMQRGEVFGAWPAGSEPSLGLAGKPTLAGLEVTEVLPDGPAAKAGIQRGDLVTRIGDKPVVGHDDVQIALAERDAGQAVTIQLSRGESAITATATLGPREP